MTNSCSSDIVKSALIGGAVHVYRQRAGACFPEQNCYHSDQFEFVVLYGRQRVGKTALINHFIDGKPAISFTGVESNAKQNLENISTNNVFGYAVLMA